MILVIWSFNEPLYRTCASVFFWTNVLNNFDFHCSMLKSEIAAFSPVAKIIFGHNVSGLVAAKQWGRVWPLMKSNILVTSSVFRASQKVSSSKYSNGAWKTSAYLIIYGYNLN